MTRLLQSLPDSAAWPVILFTGVLVTFFARPACGQDAAKEKESVPKDTCILELILPEGATINVDGNDYGAKRRVTWSKLKPGTVYQVRLTVTFPGKESDQRIILVEGGRHIRLALCAPNPKMPKIVPQMGHTVTKSVQLTLDGRWMVTGGHDGQVILWDAKTGRAVHVFKGFGTNVQHVAISNDGRRILATSWNDICVWDMESPDKPKFRRQDRDNRYATLSPDGRRVAIVGYGISKDHGVWNVDSGERISTFQEFSGIVEGVVFSPNGRQVLMSQRESVHSVAGRHSHLNNDSAILWDADTGQIIHQFEKQERVGGLPGGGVAFSPDGSKTATGAGDRLVIVWDARNGNKLLTLKGHRNIFGATGIVFSPDGRQLLSHSYHEAILWDATTGKELHRFRSMIGKVHGVAFLPEGPVAVVASGVITSGKIGQSETRILSLLSEKDICPTVSEQTSWITSVALNPNGLQMAMATLNDNSPLVWNGTTGAPHLLLGASYSAMTQFAEVLVPGSMDLAAARTKGHLEHITCLTFSPDGRQILTGSQDTTAILWDTETAKQLHKLQGHRGRSAQNQAITPGSLSRMLKYYFSGEVDFPKNDQEWRAQMEKVQRRQEVRPGWIHCVAFSADGKYAITGGYDEKAIVWECATGQAIRELPIPRTAPRPPYNARERRTVDRVALSPDGKLALTGSRFDSIASLWNVATGEKIKTLEENLSNLYALTFSSDGQPLALAQLKENSIEHHISLVNVTTGKVLRRSSAVAFEESRDEAVLSPDQKRVASSSMLKGTVVVLDLDSGVELRRIKGHDAVVNSLAFSPDGQRLLTGSEDGTCRLWDIATGQELARITPFKNQGDWLMLTPEGLFDGSAGGREKVMFRVGGGLNVVPVDRFFQDFYCPGLLAAIWRGERPLPKVQMGESLPPKVTIVAPDMGGVVEANRATVEVEVVDQGGGVRGPWLVQNGARVLASEKTEQKGKAVRRTFDVPLVQGENKLEFHAASADGSWESEPALMTLRCERPLPKPELYLVSVGINRYADKSMNLGLAAGDAQAMAGLFQQRGPSLYSVVHATTLLDEEATAPSILESLRQLSQKARPQDTVAVFLAGHGTVAGQQYYFLPHEFHRQAKTLEEDVRVQGLSASKIQEALVAIPALKRVVVFDTGQSGGKMQLASTARDPFAFRGAIERLSRASGAFMIASAAISDEAQEVPDLKHGVLTYALLAGLHATEGGPLEKHWIEPKNKDRVADVLDWFGFASAYVPQLTKQYFGRQQELQHSSLGTSFPILPVVASGTPAPIASTVNSTFEPPQKSTATVKGVGETTLYAVAVGINRYRDEAMNLKYARADAQSMASLLRSRGKRGHREVSAQEVLDAQATRNGILSALENTAKQAKAEDTLVVFFSGHGRMVGQRYYFIPADFHRQANAIEEDIQQQGVPADVLADAVSKSPARKRLLIFDTCASGGALSISRQGQEPFAFRGAIAKLGQQQGVFTIAASSAGQEAQEIDTLGHGVLTYTLLAGLNAMPSGGPLEGLNVQPSGSDGMVDVLEWFSFASGHVPRLTRQYLGQVQEVQTSAQGTSFSLLSAWQ